MSGAIKLKDIRIKLTSIQMMTGTQKLRKTMRWLRQKFPAPLDVSVRCNVIRDRSGRTYWGEVQERQGKLFVRINNRKSHPLMNEALLHEWAHVITWLGAERDIHHGGEWGLAYARIFDAFQEWNYGQGNTDTFTYSHEKPELRN